MTYQFNRQQQAGYFALLAVFFIIVIGFLGTTVTYLLVSSANSTLAFQQSEAALYIAGGGFEEAARLLLTPRLTGSNARITCAAVSGNANLTNTALGDGRFTATTVSGNPVYTFSTLTSAINRTATTIPLASATAFADAGRVMIDNEVITYGGKSGNNLVGVTRGSNFNFSTPHANGARVSQYQCMVNIRGGIPNLTSPLYEREIIQAVPAQEAWAVGVNNGSNLTLTRWSRPTQGVWNASSIAGVGTLTLNSVSMLSNADGWAVGNITGSTFLIYRWSGSAWAAVPVTAQCSNQNLMGVSAVYSNEAWAVGRNYRTNGTCTSGGGTQTYTILKWNGTSWTALTQATIPSIPAPGTAVQLNAIHVIDTNQSGAGNFGFAVGNTGTILRFNGSTWTTVSSGVTNNLFGVYVVSATEAWAVGANGRLLRWNGTAWSTVTLSPTTSQQFNAIAMIDHNISGNADYGWVVGNAGVAYRYNGSTWTSLSSGSAAMNGVAIFQTTPGEDVWAVGAAGAIRHWDGTSWATVASGVTPILRAISVIAPEQSGSGWEEIFP